MQSNLYRAPRGVSSFLFSHFLSVLPSGMLCFLAALALLSHGLLPTAAQTSGLTAIRKTLSAGAYVDQKTRARHSWQVNGAHTLLWDGAPYLPVGGTFVPRSFASDQETAWQEDVAALNTLKAHSVRDIIIAPDRSILDVPTAALQRLVDFLDANDFHYGLSFGTGMNAPLTGVVVKPSVYRYEDARELTALWQVADVDRALCFLVDAGNDFKFVRAAAATVRDGVASAPLDTPPNLLVARPIALLLPHKTLSATAQGTLPDVWSGFDNYRDRLLTYFERVKFGAGLRFYLDPLARHLEFKGDADGLIPDSDDFRLEWESFLTKNYTSPDEVRSRWLLTDSFHTMQELARLIPLWKGSRGFPFDRGFPYLYDPVAGTVHRAQISESQISAWWTDYETWRDQSLAYTMNALADTLKRQVADVPVVYTWTQQQPFFAGADPAGGFDGLAVTTRALDPNRLARATGPAYSEAEQSRRSMWLIATEVSPAPPEIRAREAAGARIVAVVTPPAASPPTGTGYANSQQFVGDFTDLRRIGIKGMFVNALQPSARPLVGASGGEGDWLHTPDSLDWLHAFGANLSSDAGAAGFVPRVLYYPQYVSGPARTALISGSSGVYWLPAAISGRPLTWWPTLAGYDMRRTEDGPVETVLLSLNGPRVTRIFVPDVSKVEAHSAEGTVLPLKVLTKSSFEMRLDATPIVFSTGGQELVPEAPAAEALVQLGLLIRLQHLQSDNNVSNSISHGQAELGEIELRQAEMYFQQKAYGGAYATARQMIDTLCDNVKPYLWMEGESNAGNNFTEVAANAEASGGAFLRLSTRDIPHNPSHYGVRYTFDIPEDEDYQVWVAGSLPGPETSPITWYVDARPEQEPASPVPQGPLYLQNRFGWIQLGKVHLARGNHNLTLKVVDRAAATGLFNYSLDTVLLMPARREFIPNATIRPLPVDPETQKSVLKSRPKQQGRGKSSQ